jgi:ParB-like chromosome segregation protein Spo0J
MPDLAEPEYEALKASIQDHGYDPAHPVVVDEAGAILDGHHRHRACAELAVTAPTVTLAGLTEDEKHDYAVRSNAAGRHLTTAQKRELVARELERNAARSDRAIGRLCGVDHKTVGAVRRGEIPQPPADTFTVPATIGEAAEVLNRWAAHEHECLYNVPVEDVPLTDTQRQLYEHAPNDNIRRLIKLNAWLERAAADIQWHQAEIERLEANGQNSVIIGDDIYQEYVNAGRLMVRSNRNLVGEYKRQGIPLDDDIPEL